MHELLQKQMIAPTLGKERNEIIDILRGFALFGVIVVNMSVDTIWADSFVSQTSGNSDDIIVFLVKFFGAGKFLTLFSFLFGLGVFMQLDRLAARKTSYFPILVRRLFILLLVGLMHYLLIGWTDILHAYAVIGIVLLIFHRGSTKLLLISAISIMILNVGDPKPLFIMAGEKILLSSQDESTLMDYPNFNEEKQKTREANYEIEYLEKQIRVYSKGSYRKILYNNWQDFISYVREFAPRWWFGSLLPLMLLGAWVTRMGILENVEIHLSFLRKVLWWCLVLGMVCSLLTLLRNILLKEQVLPFYVRQFYSLSDMVGIRALGLSYGCGVIFILRRKKWRKYFKPLASVGRTAFTNYLLQTVLAVVLFYKVGLGLYGKVSPISGALLAISFFALQLIFSNWWLKKFRFGPAEWIWRSLTYWKIQPIKMH